MVIRSHEIPPKKIPIGGWFPLPRAQSPAEHPTSQDWRRRRAEPNWHSRFCLAALRRGKMWKMVIQWLFHGDLMVDGDFIVMSWWFHSCLLVISWWFRSDFMRWATKDGAFPSQNPLLAFLVNTEGKTAGFLAGCSSSPFPEKWHWLGVASTECTDYL